MKSFFASIFQRDLFRALFSALLLVLAFPPFSLWFLAPLSVALFFDPLANARIHLKRPFFYGFFFSFSVLWASFYWLVLTLHDFAYLSWPIALLLVLVIFSLASLFSGFFARVMRSFFSKLKISHFILRFFLIFLFLILWDVADTRLFPWSPFIAFGSQETLLASVGVLSTWGWRLIFYFLIAVFLTLGIGAGKYFRWQIFSGLSFLIFLVAFFVGKSHIKKLKELYSERQPVALLQGNVGNFEKRLTKLEVMPTVKNVLSIYRNLVDEASIEFKDYRDSQGKDVEAWVFWPETSLPLYPIEDPVLTTQLTEWAQQLGGMHWVGAYHEEKGLFNGESKTLDYNILAQYHEKAGYGGYYQKRIRMPFGEYVPGDKWYPWVYKKFSFLSHFGAGYIEDPLLHPDEQGPAFLPLICYEILIDSFVDDFVERSRKKHPQRPLVLMNPTNDSWFGKSSEPFLHALLARWQAARQSLAMIRPTNTGWSMVVAPWGELLYQGRMDQTEVIFGHLPVKKTILRK